MRHWSVTQSDSFTTLDIPTPSDVAATLPSEAVQYDINNPPVSGSVQRGLEDAPH